MMTANELRARAAERREVGWEATDVMTPREMEQLANTLDRARTLIQCLIDEDPSADAADGVSVLDVWRKDARRFIASTDSK